MKKTLLLPFFLLSFLLSFGQYVPEGISSEKSKAPALASPSPDGYMVNPHPPSVPQSDLGFRDMEEPIGTTTFELQTVASMGRRMGEFSDGSVSAIWHFGMDEAGGYPDRGAGYNHFTDDEWGSEPNESVETERGGYPSFTVSPNGLEAIVSHKAVGAGWGISVHVKQPGETEWTEHDIPSDVFNGNVWGKIAAGGPDGNTLHVLAISLSPAFGGDLHVGMDAHPLYFRSKDGGATWDVQDFIIPGIDSSFYLSMDSEAYTIEADGETVAIGVFPYWGDMAIAKSTDNGDTWEKTIVKDFPLDKYDEMGYDSTQIPMDPNAPNSLAILTSDGTGSLLIDEGGKVHVFFGYMYVWNEGAPGFFLDLGTNGIAYWNEDRATDDLATIAEVEDFDMSGTIDIDGATLGDLRYGNAGLTSFPTSARDADGNLYVIYQAMREDLLNADDFNYRHIFIIKSEDDGENWSVPFDIINPDVTDVPEFIEAAYPSMPPILGDALNLTYLQDITPGQTPDGTEVPEQLVMHVQLNRNTFGIFSDAEEVAELDATLSISPNPATDLVQVKYDLPQAHETQLRVVSLLGEVVLLQNKRTQSAGAYTQYLDVSALSGGVYFVQLKMGDEQMVRKLVVR